MKYENSVIGISRHADSFSAVLLGRSGDSFEVLWHCEKSAAGLSWDEFCSDICSQIGNEGKRPMVVAGYDSRNVVFYPMALPPVKASQMAPLVRVQAETVLPLGIDQMSIAWQLCDESETQADVLLAAARRGVLGEYARMASVCGPDMLALDCDAICAVWNHLYERPDTDQKNILLYLKCTCCQAYLLEDGHLRRVATLDHNFYEYASESNSQSSMAMFFQDLASVIEDFGVSSTDVRMYIIGQDRQIAMSLAECLNSQNYNAAWHGDSAMKLRFAAGIEKIETDCILEAAGLAILGLAEDEPRFSIFDEFTRSEEKEKKPAGLSALLKPAIAAVILLIIYIGVSAASAIMTDGKLRSLDDELDFSKPIARQKLRKEVASRRADMLDLLGLLSEARGQVTVTDLTYERGRKVVVEGFYQGPGQELEFQKALEQQKGITNVLVSNFKRDPKKNHTQFKAEFDYRNFTGGR